MLFVGLAELAIKINKQSSTRNRDWMNLRDCVYVPRMLFFSHCDERKESRSSICKVEESVTSLATS